MVDGNRRRQNIACLTCKRRKVRCDAIDAGQGSCTPCRRLGAECVPNNEPLRVRSPRVRRKLRPSGGSNATRARDAVGSRPEVTRQPSSHSAHNNDSSGDNGISDGLSKFLDRGISSLRWAEFAAGSEPVRMVYIGTRIANLHHLVASEKSGLETTHYPFPQIHPILPWKPTLEQLRQKSLDHIARDIGSFPTKPVCDALVDSYFKFIHPGYPILDEQEFRSQYGNPDNPPPLLLLQAVLLGGAHVTDHPIVAASRFNVTSTLFRRAKYLFDIRHENDRLYLVQAALLMVWHIENSDTVSCNSYYWIGVACRIALGLGMHRDLSPRAENLMPPCDRRVYRRVWWTLFQVEVFSALEHGRPCMIRAEDFDQSPYDDVDFKNADGTADSGVERDFCCLNTDLAHLGLEILGLQAPRANMNVSVAKSACNSQLASLALRIPTTQDFWSCQLRIHYNFLILLSNRQLTSHGLSPLPPQEQTTSSSLPSTSAITILTIFETMHLNHTIHQSWFTSVCAIMACIIQFSHEIRHAIADDSSMESLLAALNSNSQLERLIESARALAEYWANAGSVLKLCEKMNERYGILLRGLVEQQQQQYQEPRSNHTRSASRAIAADLATHSESVGQGFIDTSWQDLLAEFHNDPALQFGQEFEQGDEWMNTSALFG